MIKFSKELRSIVDNDMKVLNMPKVRVYAGSQKHQNFSPAPQSPLEQHILAKKEGVTASQKFDKNNT